MYIKHSETVSTYPCMLGGWGQRIGVSHGADMLEWTGLRAQLDSATIPHLLLSNPESWLLKRSFPTELRVHCSTFVLGFTFQIGRIWRWSYCSNNRKLTGNNSHPKKEVLVVARSRQYVFTLENSLLPAIFSFSFCCSEESLTLSVYISIIYYLLWRPYLRKKNNDGRKQMCYAYNFFPGAFSSLVKHVTFSLSLHHFTDCQYLCALCPRCIHGAVLGTMSWLSFFSCSEIAESSSAWVELVQQGLSSSLTNSFLASGACSCLMKMLHCSLILCLGPLFPEHSSEWVVILSSFWKTGAHTCTYKDAQRLRDCPSKVIFSTVYCHRQSLGLKASERI